MTEDVDLNRNLDKVLSSVDLIYRARYRAAREFLKRLVRQDIRVIEGTASVPVEGHLFQYRIQRVVNIYPPVSVARELIGVLSNVIDS